jgi:hypothetical protein
MCLLLRKSKQQAQVCLRKGEHKTSMTLSSVKIQVCPDSRPSIPSWFGEVAAFAQVLAHMGRVKAIEERVRFARARFGEYDTIDFVVVLIGYALSGEATLKTFYERLLPFADSFMALFGRSDLPHRSSLSRFLAALDQSGVEALRTLFEEDLVARCQPGTPPGGVWDRKGSPWLVADVDATKQAARQRALPHTPALPDPHRRMNLVCAPGYLGRKRGEVMRTRTTILQAHTHQWLGTYGNAGNGDYRGELLRAGRSIVNYAKALSIPLEKVIVRLDGLYGNTAPLLDLLGLGLAVIGRCKEYSLLDLPQVQAVLSQPPREQTTNPESGTSRALFDCPAVPLGAAGMFVRLLIATHPASTTPASIGKTRDGIVYELFWTVLPQDAFLPSDVLDLYLHRGSFETVLSDEDQEQDPDRWCSRTHWGQEFWQIIAQWVWNLRLELGHQLQPTAMRLTEFAPAQAAEPVQVVESCQAVESTLIRVPAQIVEPTAAIEPIQVVESYQAVESTPIMEPAQAAEPVQVVESCQAVESTLIRVPAQIIEPTAAIEPIQVVESYQAVESTPIMEPAQAAEPVQVVESIATTELASAVEPVQVAHPVSYGPPQWARQSYTKGFAGSDFPAQPDGTLRCPANHPLYPQERRHERNGSVRVLYAARIGHCRPCPLRPQCQEKATTIRPRRVSAVFWPVSSNSSALVVSAAPVPVEPVPVESVPTAAEPAPSSVRPLAHPPACPVLWGDWERCQIRRRWLRLLRTQTVTLTVDSAKPEPKEDRKEKPVQTRAERAHWRLSWDERLARNARLSSAPSLLITIHGLPATFAQFFGFVCTEAA